MRDFNRIRSDDVFNDALGLQGRDRSAFLDATCGRATAARFEVDSLLEAHDGAQGFLLAESADPPEQDHGLVGRAVGRYRITRLIGHGGMSTVWRAVRLDDSTMRPVAVKIIRRDIVIPHVRSCFNREREALGSLRHDNITALLDAGVTHDRLLYLVMEYVDGKPIDVYCDSFALGLRDRIKLFVKVCEAVQHAHQHLIVHRDLKPANVLVTAAGVPKLLDFGIAKIMEEGNTRATVRTVTALRIMTPRYASPEQLRGEPVTVASDIFSLGAMLYELLCGRPAWRADSAAPSTWRHRAIPDEPIPPSEALLGVPAGLEFADSREAESIGRSRGLSPERLRRQLRGDLDNIVLMALRGDPNRRYASVAQLALDLRAHLTDRPLLARRDSIGYVAGKLVRRYKLAFGLASASMFFLVAGIFGISLALIDARHARGVAEKQEAAAMAAMHRAESVSDFLGQTLAAANPFRHRGTRAVVDVLKEASIRLEQGGLTRPDVTAEIHQRLGDSYADLWMWQDVLRHATMASNLYRDLKPDSEPYALSLMLLGRAQTFLKIPESEVTQREALRILEAVCGPDHPASAQCQVSLAFALWHGVSPPRLSEAEWRAVEGVETLRRVTGGPTHRLGVCTMSLGVLKSNLGKLEEGERYLRAAVEIFEALPYGVDRYYVQTLDRLAHTLRQLHRYDEEEVFLHRALSHVPPGFASSQVAEGRRRLREIVEGRGNLANGLAIFGQSWAELVRLLRRQAQEDPYWVPIALTGAAANNEE